MASAEPKLALLAGGTATVVAAALFVTVWTVIAGPSMKPLWSA